MYERHTSTYELCMLHAKFRQIIEQKVTVSFSMRSILLMYTQTLSTSLSTCFIVWLYVYLSVCLSVHPYSSEAQKAGAEQDNG